jgi:ABC-type Fe3+ transport system permease subunit
VVYERALIRWQRVMPLEMPWFTNVFTWKCKIDKRGPLQRFIQGSGIHTPEGFKFERQTNFT